MSRYEEHPLRKSLNDEIHARPPIPLQVPECVTFLAFLHVDGSVGREDIHLRQLAQQLGLPEPTTETGHVILESPEFRLKWQRHNEFSSYAFFRHMYPGDASDVDALLAVPTSWRDAIPGQLIAATHIEVKPISEVPPDRFMSQLSPGGQTHVAAQIGDGAAWVFTDFQLHDGFSRFLMVDASLTPRQAGRMVQRLLEIEIYRVMALLAFPVAKQVGRLLSRTEDELADLMDDMGTAQSSEDERKVLARLTRLAADVERSVAKTTFRFGAAAAYYRLVQQRIDELREVRLSGYPTISEFMERRLAPAINTCAAIARRQDDLSARIARNSQLLRTRVDIELERQNQELLAQMNNRAKLQLRLQETVEGLSVFAITYYGSQLVNYLAKGAKDFLPITPEVLTALSIPVIAIAIHLAAKRTRRMLSKEEAH